MTSPASIGASIGSIGIEPDPAPAGGEVEVSYDGPGDLYWRTIGGSWERVPIDPKTGKGRIRVPTGRRALLFTNHGKNPVSAEFEIVSPNR